MSDVSYVRTEMVPEQEPPASTTGIIGWMRENLFSGWFNTVLTVLSALLIFFVLSVALPWLFSPTWQAASLNECRAILHELGRDGHFAGACWGVIRDRWVQLFFGFYPADLYWRPILAFLLLGMALAPVLFSDKVSPKLLWFSAIYPVLFPWMLWGGAVWTPLLVLAGFVLAYLVYSYVERSASSLVGLIAAVVFAAVWFAWGVGAVSGLINSSIGAARIDGQLEQTAAEIDRLQSEIARLEGEIETAEAAVNAVMEGEASAEESGGRAYRDLIAEARPLRDKLDALRSEIGLAATTLSDLQSYERQMEQLPALIEKLPGLRDAADAARAALPDTVSKVVSENGFKALTKRIVDENLDIPSEDVDALEEVLRLEGEVLFTEQTVESTYANAALIGLRPVESRNFGGMMLSLTIGVVAIAISLPLGILLALGRQSNLPLLKALCVGFIEFIRGVPLITLLFVASTLLNIFLPPGTNFDIILRVIIMATLFASAYMAEVVRGGLAALPKGQYEGADSLGLNYWQAQRLIIMPQALKISIPGIVSTFIGLFKDTTLVSIIGLLDPLGLSNNIRADAAWNGVVWEIYGFIALMFFVFCFSMSRYSMYLERKLHTGHSR
nr:amino acid ABC transporter permease [Marimonas arenosa]